MYILYPKRKGTYCGPERLMWQDHISHFLTTPRDSQSPIAHIRRTLLKNRAINYVQSKQRILHLMKIALHPVGKISVKCDLLWNTPRLKYFDTIGAKLDDRGYLFSDYNTCSHSWEHGESHLKCHSFTPKRIWSRIHKISWTYVDASSEVKGKFDEYFFRSIHRWWFLAFTRSGMDFALNGMICFQSFDPTSLGQNNAPLVKNNGLHRQHRRVKSVIVCHWILWFARVFDRQTQWNLIPMHMHTILFITFCEKE